MAVSSAQGVYGQSARLAVTLTASGQPLVRKVVRFALDAAVGSLPSFEALAVTDASGVAAVDAPTSAVAAGEYQNAVRATFAGDYWNTPAESRASLAILRASPTITWLNPAAIVYGTALGAAELNATANVPGSLVYSPAIGTRLPAGRHTLSVTFTPSDAVNYNAASARVEIEVTRAMPSLTVAGGSFTYDGQPHVATATLSGVDGEPLGPMTITYAGLADPPVNAGTYPVIVSFDGDSNYRPATDSSASIVIGKATPAIAVTGGEFTYDGQAHTATGSVTGVGGALLGALTFTYNGFSDLPVNAGSYVVVATFAGDANYAAASDSSANIIINKAGATIALGNLAHRYDGSPKAVDATTEPAELSGLSISYDGATDPPTNAGSYAVVASLAHPNYTAPDATALMTIARATPTLNVTGDVFTYDGNPHAATGSATGVGGVDLGPVTFTYNGAADVPVNAGTYTVVGSFAGNANYAVASHTTATIVINQATTDTSVASSPTSSVFGQPVTLTASVRVTSGGSTPAGSVEFFSGASSLGTAMLVGSAGTASAPITTSSLIIGPHAITAVYRGESNFAGSTSAATPHAVQRAATATTVASLANPSVWGQMVTLTATVDVVAPGAGTATGTVEFFNGTVSLGQTALTVVEGKAMASLSTTALAVGSHAIAATYAGDGNFEGSASPSLAQSVNRASTSTVLASSPNPSGFGEAVTVTANVSVVAPGAGTMTGAVEFFDGATSLGTVPLISTASGATASLTMSGLTSGSHTLSARYAGDGNFAGSDLSPVAHTVKALTASTITSLAAGPNPAALGAVVTLSASVRLMLGTSTPTGNVEFFDGPQSLGTAPLINGRATLMTNALAVGNHSLTAHYVGDGTLSGSTSAPAAVSIYSGVKPATTTTTLVAMPNPSAYGQPVVLTATVNGKKLIPTGGVEFFADGRSIGRMALNPAGLAALSISTLSRGLHSVTAQYLGDANFAGSVSNTTYQCVECLTLLTSPLATAGGGQP
jgi:hypothetical protein